MNTKTASRTVRPSIFTPIKSVFIPKGAPLFVPGARRARNVRSRIYFGGEKIRIDEMRELIERELPNLSVTVAPVPENSLNANVRGHRKAMNAARSLRDTKAFELEIDRALSHDVFVDAIDPIVVTQKSADEFARHVGDLHATATAVLRGLKALTLDTTETQVVFRMPGNQDLSGLVKDLGQLDRLLTQAVVNKYVGGAVRLAGFDRGSEWLLIDLESLKAVGVLVMMHKYLLWWREMEADIALKREQALSLRIDNNAKQQIDDAFDTQLKEREEEAVALILEAGGIPKTEHELFGRVMLSIKSLGELVKRGLDVGPVTTTPDSIREIFDGLTSFPEVQKKLADGLGMDPGETGESEDEE